MVAFLLNPGGRKRRRKGKARSRKARGHRKGHRRSYRRSRKSSRRSISARRSYRRRAYRKWRLAAGAQFQKAIAGMACSKAGRKRFFRMARSCRVRPASSSGGELKTAAQLGYRSVANNPGRRRRRRNGRRSHRRNPYSIPQFAMNPGLSAVMKGYSLPTITSVIPLAGGFIASPAVAALLSKYLPASLSGGIFDLVIGSVAAGLTGALTALVAPRYSKMVFMGGMANVAVSGLNQYVRPIISKTMKGLGDYATRADVQAARPLGCYGGCTGAMGQLVNESYRDANVFTAEETPMSIAARNPFTLGPDFTQPITPEDMDSQLEYNENQKSYYAMSLGDYLTPQAAAAARPLGYMGHTMNDVMIEGTATHELSLV